MPNWFESVSLASLQRRTICHRVQDLIYWAWTLLSCNILPAWALNAVMSSFTLLTRTMSSCRPETRKWRAQINRDGKVLKLVSRLSDSLNGSKWLRCKSNSPAEAIAPHSCSCSHYA
jgi:hypothetical protein